MRFPYTVRLVLLISLFVAACDSSDPDPDPVPITAVTATDIPADPTLIPPSGGPPVSTGRFTLYSLREERIVLASSEVDATVRQQDSVSTAWDIGLRGTTLIFNGGTSGPGEGAAQILAQPFADVLEATEAGYFADGDNTACPALETPAGPVPGTPYAVCSGSDNGWYNYNAPINLISPLAGRTIVLKTADGLYAKLRILNYYQGNPNPPDPALPGRYFTFEYLVQPDGSRTFETTTAE